MQEIKEVFGKIQILESGKEFGSSILIIEPGKEIKEHYHRKTKEVEVVLEGHVHCGDRIQKAGDINVWETEEYHGYKNESKAVVKILCITFPPYDPKDVFEED